MAEMLPPGSTIGILGGGQLGRMLSVAASRLGLKTHIFEPAAKPPAGQVADMITTAGYDDLKALGRFAASVDVITYEFENIPTAALDHLETLRPIHPNRKALATSQDRIVEKEFLQSLGLKVAPFAQIDTLNDLQSALKTINTPCILKTRRFGYDGKGQIRIDTITEAKTAFDALNGAPAVLEGFVVFEREISVIAARNQNAEVACYDPGENLHQSGILHTTSVPAQLSMTQQTDAVILAGRILNALDYIGVMGVELFVTTSGLIVNEIAPRVHNSGHWTQNGCLIDQFEQHIRAVAGWPLGDGQRHSNVVMTNLIGDDTYSKDANIGLHLYGKSATRPGRKMGHVNVISAKT